MLTIGGGGGEKTHPFAALEDVVLTLTTLEGGAPLVVCEEVERDPLEDITISAPAATATITTTTTAAANLPTPEREVVRTMEKSALPYLRRFQDHLVLSRAVWGIEPQQSESHGCVGHLGRWWPRSAGYHHGRNHQDYRRGHQGVEEERLARVALRLG